MTRLKNILRDVVIIGAAIAVMAVAASLSWLFIGLELMPSLFFGHLITSGK